MEMKDHVKMYLDAGWKLAPIPKGTKGPVVQGWNRDGGWLKSVDDLPPNHGVGLLHAFSGTMALDIDSGVDATPILKDMGVDLGELIKNADSVSISSSSAGKWKMLFKMPDGLILPTKKIMVGNVTAFELRNATTDGKSVQDVLPPSIHPNGRAYVWHAHKSFTELPLIPLLLLQYWQGLVTKKDEIATRERDESQKLTRDCIAKMLDHLDASCGRKEWIDVGMALHDWDAEEGYSLWDEWSRRSEKYEPNGGNSTSKQWSSFKPKDGGITIATLIEMYRISGGDMSVLRDDGLSSFSPILLDSEETEEVDSVDEMPEPRVIGEIKAPDFNMDSIPKILKQRALEISDSIGCDPLVPVFSGLAAVCAVVDARSRLEILPGFTVPPVLWLMTIGAPADKKSPGSRPMLSPLRDIEAADKPRYAKEFLQWEGAEAAFVQSKKAYLEYSASTENMFAPKDAPDVLELPPKPSPLKLTITDITSQMMVRAAADRPQGILCYLDEMNSWVKKMVDRTSGEDRSAWVVAYESEPYKMERVGAGEIYCDNLAISIYGNIQPAVFRQAVASLAADGMLQRFVPAILRPEMTRLGEPIPEFMTSSADWKSLLENLANMPTMYYRLSNSAFNAYREFQKWYEQRKRDERLIGATDEYMTAFGKTEGLVGRIALVFHLIENPLNNVVSIDTLNSAIEFVKGYVLPSLKYAFSELAFASTFDFDLGAEIMKQPAGALIDQHTFRPLSLKHDPLKYDRMFISSIIMYESLGWVVRRGKQWIVNPKLSEMYAEHNKNVADACKRLTENA